MGLKSTIQGLAATAFDVVSDLLIKVDYQQFVEAEFVTSTGVNTNRYLSHKSVSVLFETYKKSEIDGKQTLAEDRKVSIPNNDLDLVPKPKDRLKIIENSQVWRVFDVDVDPADALYILHCRRVT